MLTQTITNDSQLYHDLQATSGYKDNFSYEGAKVLQEWLEQLSEDTGENIEYDPIAFCCEFSEYESAFQCAGELQLSVWDDLTDMDDEEAEEVCLEYLQHNTMVIEFDGGIIIQDF